FEAKRAGGGLDLSQLLFGSRIAHIGHDGIVDVACFAAEIAFPPVTMTSTLDRTNSATNSVMRSSRPSAQRYSILMVRPSIQPSSRSRLSNSSAGHTDFVTVPRNPIVGTFRACWLIATRGHESTAPPNTVMNSRRLIRSPHRRRLAARTGP